MTDQQVKEMFESYGQYAHGHDYALVRAIEAVVSPKRAWVGMTDEEKAQFVVAYYPSSWDRKTAVALMSDYEEYLKEKNT